MPFEQSLFRTKSKNALSETVLDPDFIVDLEVQQANKSIDEYILKSPQSSVNTSTAPELSEQSSITLGSPLFPSTSSIIPSKVHYSPPFVPTLHHQPIISHLSPTSPGSSSTLHQHLNLSHPTTMENRYAPLVLPAQLGAMPADYQSKIIQFDGTGHDTAQQHVNKITDYFELHEIDTDNVQMRLFAQTLAGDVRKWFRAFPVNSIDSLETFHQQFLNRWEKKKDPYKSFQNMEILEGDLMKLFKMTTPDSTVYIMPAQLILDPHLT